MIKNSSQKYQELLKSPLSLLQSFAEKSLYLLLFYIHPICEKMLVPKKTTSKKTVVLSCHHLLKKSLLLLFYNERIYDKKTGLKNHKYLKYLTFLLGIYKKVFYCYYSKCSQFATKKLVPKKQIFKMLQFLANYLPKMVLLFIQPICSKNKFPKITASFKNI
jgi:hypothetical protein